MDPKVALAELRELYRAVLEGADEDTEPILVELAERIDNLDSWMTRGGYSPWGKFGQFMGGDR